MQLIYDLTRNLLVQKAGSSTPLSKETIVRGDERLVTLRFVRGATPVTLDGTVSTMIFVAKANTSLTATTILLANDFTYNAETGEWTGTITQNLSALFDLLGNRTGVELFGELTFSTSTRGVTTSQIFGVRVTNDLWKGDEGTPLSLPSPDEWLESRRPGPLTRTAIPVNGRLAESLTNYTIITGSVGTITIGGGSYAFSAENYLAEGRSVNGALEWFDRSPSYTGSRIYFDTGYWYFVRYNFGVGELGTWRAAGSYNTDPTTLTFVAYNNCTGSITLVAQAGVLPAITGTPGSLMQSALVNHLDGITHTEWACSSISPFTWIPRTPGLLRDRTRAAWMLQYTTYEDSAPVTQTIDLPL